MIPSPVLNKHTRQYLVIDGYLTNAGYRFLKMMNVYRKCNNNSSTEGLTPNKKAGLKQIMGKYSGKASLSTINNFEKGCNRFVK